MKPSRRHYIESPHTYITCNNDAGSICAYRGEISSRYYTTRRARASIILIHVYMEKKIFRSLFVATMSLPLCVVIIKLTGSSPHRDDKRAFIRFPAEKGIENNDNVSPRVNVNFSNNSL